MIIFDTLECSNILNSLVQSSAVLQKANAADNVLDNVHKAIEVVKLKFITSDPDLIAASSMQ